MPFMVWAIHMIQRSLQFAALVYVKANLKNDRSSNCYLKLGNMKLE